MANLSDIADRIKAKKEAYVAKADEWARRLDALDHKEPEAFAAGDAAVAWQEKEINDMESMVKGLSNLPPVSSAPSLGAAPPALPDGSHS